MLQTGTLATIPRGLIKKISFSLLTTNGTIEIIAAVLGGDVHSFSKGIRALQSSALATASRAFNFFCFCF